MPSSFQGRGKNLLDSLGSFSAGSALVGGQSRRLALDVLAPNRALRELSLDFLLRWSQRSKELAVSTDMPSFGLAPSVACTHSPECFDPPTGMKVSGRPAYTYWSRNTCSWAEFLSALLGWRSFRAFLPHSSPAAPSFRWPILAKARAVLS